MANLTKVTDLVNITLTKEQFHLFIDAMEQLKQQHLNVAEWTGESAEEIEARFQFPHDDILDDMLLEDMADYQSAIPSGIVTGKLFFC